MRQEDEDSFEQFVEDNLEQDILDLKKQESGGDSDTDFAHASFKQNEIKMQSQQQPKRPSTSQQPADKMNRTNTKFNNEKLNEHCDAVEEEF
jgi:hypothetical protein